MANPQRPDPGQNGTGTSRRQSSSTWIYGGIAAIIILLLILFFGGFLGNGTALQDDVATPAVTEPSAQDDAEVITSDPPTTAPPATIPDSQTDMPALAPATREEDTIEIQGDAEVEVLDES